MAVCVSTHANIYYVYMKGLIVCIYVYVCVQLSIYVLTDYYRLIPEREVTKIIMPIQIYSLLKYSHGISQSVL
jgi:hypothetical protein